ncbi:MAG: helix-turn-helix domain-containing protein [Candidatus Thorarchaeota archaeon]|jgi:transposase
MGRKSKLTPELLETIVELLEAGNYDIVAAQAVGITRATFYRWIRKGKEDKEGEHFEFYQAVERAKAKGETELLATIRRASNRTWTAAAWILERSRPERWSLRKAKENAVEFWKKEILGMVKSGDVTFDDVVETVGEELAYELFNEAGISISRGGETPADSSSERTREPAKISE